MDTAGNPVPNRLGTGFPSLGNDIPEAREQDSRPTGRTLYVTGIKKEEVSDRKSDTSSFYESERSAFSADGACQGILRKSEPACRPAESAYPSAPFQLPEGFPAFSVQATQPAMRYPEEGRIRPPGRRRTAQGESGRAS